MNQVVMPRIGTIAAENKPALAAFEILSNNPKRNEPPTISKMSIIPEMTSFRLSISFFLTTLASLATPIVKVTTVIRTPRDTENRIRLNAVPKALNNLRTVPTTGILEPNVLDSKYSSTISKMSIIPEMTSFNDLESLELNNLEIFPTTIAIVAIINKTPKETENRIRFSEAPSALNNLRTVPTTGTEEPNVFESKYSSTISKTSIIDLMTFLSACLSLTVNNLAIFPTATAKTDTISNIIVDAAKRTSNGEMYPNNAAFKPISHIISTRPTISILILGSSLTADAASSRHFSTINITNVITNITPAMASPANAAAGPIPVI